MADKPEPRIKYLLPYEGGLMFPAGFLANRKQTVGDRLTEVKAIQHKPNDILVCTYPKSGTHWMASLVKRLLKVHSHTGSMLRLIEESNYRVNPHESEQNVPRLLFSHLRPQWLPQEHLEKNGKIILCLRNPKDIAVSFFHHLDRIGHVIPSGSWNSYLELFMAGKTPFGSFVNYAMEWDKFICTHKDNNVIVIFYEDLLSDGLPTLRRLQAHLGIYESDTTLQKLLSESSFENLKQEASNLAAKDVNAGVRDPDGKSVIYRKGVIGDWRNHFTINQNEHFDRLVHDKLRYCSLVQKLGLLTSKY